VTTNVKFERERSVVVQQEGAVVTIQLLPFAEAFALDPPADVHWDLQAVLNQIRDDHSVRVVVITGRYDGEFLVTPKTSTYERPAALARLADPAAAHKLMSGIVRLHTTMTELEQPIIAKVNGDAVGFGQSIAFSSDLIYAWEDARFSDVHLGQGEVRGGIDSDSLGPPFGTVPGDGAGVTVPLFMSPVRAKEYLMLAQTLSGAELAAMHCINSAVAPDDLDELVDTVAAKLLSRSPYALGWTKRLVNRHVVDQLHRGLDLGIAYELLNFAHAEREITGEPSAPSPSDG